MEKALKPMVDQMIEEVNQKSEEGEIDRHYCQRVCENYIKQAYMLGWKDFTETEGYQFLEERNKKLNKLEAGGVDNWEGYDMAMSLED